MNVYGKNILELNGLSIDELIRLSYRSELGRSLKTNIDHLDKSALLAELTKMTEWLDEQDIESDIALDYRIKSIESIASKYDRYYNAHRQVRQVFNDILGFRAFCDNYDSLSYLQDEYFRVVDMRNDKSNDDGYRGVHVYFEIDHFHYPIVIQFNTLIDRQINKWLHDYLS